jgi:hypothetical protein
MTNNKQQTAVEWLWEIAYNRELTSEAWKQAKEMEAIGKEMSYDDGYAEGYKRALGLIKWNIENQLNKLNTDHIGDTNEMI